MDLPTEMLAIVREEQTLLDRVVLCLQKAWEVEAHRRPVSELRSIEALRDLRDDAMSASEDDLPALMLELAVRQRLLERPERAPLPELATPYIAHLRVREGAVDKDYLLGRVNYLKPSEGVRIVDWRTAPVAQIFYRYREGDEYEESFPGRVAEGVVQARRIVVVQQGRLRRIVGDDHLLACDEQGHWHLEDRGALSLQAGGAGTAVRPGSLGVGVGTEGRARQADVTALLDAEQFDAVATPPERALLVLGTAGSGKTTVALHRLARIAALAPERYPLADMAVLVPEEGLARLSRRLLAPLGVGDAQVRTLDSWSSRLAMEVFGSSLPPSCPETPALVTGLKRHPALYHALTARFARLKPANAKVSILLRRLTELYTDRAFLAEVVDASAGELPRSAIEEMVRHTMLQLADPIRRQLASITVAERKRAIDGRAIEEGTPEELAGTVDIDDLPILLFLKAWRAGLQMPSFAHLVLDEAEDFSLFELYVIGKLLPSTPSLTVAGDEAQQTSSSFAGWGTLLETLGAKGAATCHLALSYRCPQPVVDLAQRLLGSMATEARGFAKQGGVPVGRFHFPEESQAQLFLAGAISDLAGREPRASVAVIAQSRGAAKRFHELLGDLRQARLVLEGEFSFEPGIDVTDVDNAKGLEFDYVIVPDASAEAYPDTDEARRRLHVAVTRTSHQLWLVSSGTRTPLDSEA